MIENPAASAKSLSGERSERLCGLIAIETSGRTGSVAWVDGEQTPKLIHLDATRRTAATLTAAIAELLAEAAKQNRTVDVVAVANGPGSFTGLRIGVTAAKMLAYALPCRLVAVDTLAAMAAALWRTQPTADSACLAINAYRQQLFVARWSRSDWDAAVVSDRLASGSQVWSAAAWQAELAAAEVGVTRAAEPSVVRASETMPGVDAGALVPLWPTAIDVAEVGLRLAHGGHFVSPLELKPNYLRDSAAEEKLR